MKQQSLLSETGGQKEAFECLTARRITLRYPFAASGTRWPLITLCYARSSFQPSSWVEKIHFQYLLKAFQLLHKDSLRDLWDNIKCTNMQFIRVPEEEEKKKAYEKKFEEIIVENFPNMEKEIVNQVQEA